VPSESYEIRPIGVVASPLTDPADAPMQGDEGSPEAWLVFEPQVAPALEGIEVGDRLVVLTWLHRADRSVLRVHPRDDAGRPLQGVFATRSAERPNPVGLHTVTVAEALPGDESRAEGPRLRVRHLEAVDGTPIVDVKPVLAASPDRR
jgi:tRNA-Thr(GGU) m(6)t(6)A37 methyltransferase TsaA